MMSRPRTSGPNHFFALHSPDRSAVLAPAAVALLSCASTADEPASRMMQTSKSADMNETFGLMVGLLSPDYCRELRCKGGSARSFEPSRPQKVARPVISALRPTRPRRSGG